MFKNINILGHSGLPTMTELTIHSRIVNGKIQKRISNPEIPYNRNIINGRTGKALKPGEMVTKSFIGKPGHTEVSYITLRSDEHPLNIYELIKEEYPTNYVKNHIEQFNKDTNDNGRIMLTGVRNNTTNTGKIVDTIEVWTMERFFKRYGENRNALCYL